MDLPENPARQNITEIRTWIESLRLWILSALACLADWTQSRELRLWVQTETRAARRNARGLIFLLAFAQIDVPHRRKGGGRTLRAPRGFRFQRRRNNTLRHFLYACARSPTSRPRSTTSTRSPRVSRDASVGARAGAGS